MLILVACGGGGGGSSGDGKGGNAGGDSSSENGGGNNSGNNSGGNNTGGNNQGGNGTNVPPSNAANAGGSTHIPLLQSLITDQGLVGEGRIIDDTIRFSGIATSGDVVQMYLNGSLVGSSMARSDGTWVLDYTMIPLLAGSYSATLIAISPAGVSVNASRAFLFTYDPNAPAAPVITDVTDDTGTLADGITQDNRLLINGTAAPNLRVELFANGVLLGSTTSASDGSWQYDHSAVALADGTYTLAAETVYLTLRSATSVQFNLVVDTQVPTVPVLVGVVPDTGVSSTDSITSSPNLSFTGTGEIGSQVRVVMNNTVIGSATVDGTGNWTMNYGTVTLAEGNYSVQAFAVDPAGNSSTTSAAHAFSIDRTAPPVGTVDAVIPDTGVAGDGITNNNQVSFAGTAAASEYVAVYLNGALLGNVQADGNGDWTYDHSATALANGTYSVTAVVSDTAGNAAAASAPFTLVVDATPPATPAVTGITTDTGTAGDEITADTTLVFSGTADANIAVQIFRDATPIGTVTSNGSGNWSFDYSGTVLAPGTYSITAVAVDVAGNTSSTSAALSVFVDTSAPAAPAVTTITTDSGTAGDGITNDTTLIFGGTAESNSTVTVFVNAASVGTATANGLGAWSYNHTGTTLTTGSYAITATATDVAGNTSVTSSAFNITIDTGAPSAPVVSSITNDTGTPGDGITSDTTLIFSGTAEANSTVTVLLNAVSIGTAATNGLGNWSYNHTGTTLAGGSYSVTATATDVAGNTSVASAAFSVTVDTGVPAAPVVTGITTDTGTAGDGITNDTTLIFSGTAEANSTVTVLLNALSLGTATTNGSGNWSYNHTATTLASGSYAVTATATDAAGNISLASSAFNVTVDTGQPATPAVTGITTDTGTAGDGITNDTTLIFSGTAEANGTVTVLINAVSVGTATVNGAGNWSYDHTGTTLAGGAYAITVTVTDSAGNTSAASSAFNVTIDIGVPAAPVVTGITTDSGAAGDGITNDTTLIFSGTAEVNSTVTVLLNAVSIGTATTNGTGNWSYNHTGTTLVAGSYAVTATATDAAGNTSVASAAFNVTVDVGVPSAPAVTGITTDSGTAGDGVTNDTTLIFSGTAEANSTVAVLVDAVSVGTATASGAGSWSYDHTGTTLAIGSHSITATATDSAGNTSAASAAFSVTIDTAAPLISTLSPVDDATGVQSTDNLVMTFDSVVSAQSGNITIRRAADNSVFEQIPVGDARVTGSGTTTITVNPTGSFIGGVGYYVQIDANAFTDVAGNGYAGIANTTSWSFTVVGLTLSSSTPADNATNVVLNSSLVLNFNLAALSSSGNIVIRHSSDNSVFETIAVGSGQVSGTGTSTVTITSSDVFLPNTGYYVEIDAGAFVGGNGATFAGITGSSTLNFTTANPSVPTVTSVTSSTANGTYTTGNTVVVEVVFSEIVNVTLATPQVTLDLEGIDRTVSYVSGSGSTTLLFNYTVAFGDVSADLDYVATSSLSTNGARIRSANYVNANLALPVPAAAGSLGANKNIVIAASTIGVGSLGSSDGFQVQGSNATGHLGWSVHALGDVNGDGFEDFVTGAPDQGGNAGVAFVVFGVAGATRSNIDTSTLTNNANGFRIVGQSATDHLGATVGGAGDINDDGYDDIYVMAPNDDNYGTDAGIVYVIFGKAGSTDVNISSFSSSNGFRITTAETSAAIGDSMLGYVGNGQAIGAGGDFNGDGMQDLVIGLRLSDEDGTNSGKAYVIFGRTGATRSDVDLDLIDPTGTDGVLIRGASMNWQLGQAARFVGDYDADGYDDVVVSAMYSNALSVDAGQSFLVFGSPGPVFNAVNVAGLNGSSGFKISASENGGLIGHAVAGGDFNGDGISDLFVSQNGYSITAGAAYVIYGDAGGVYSNIAVDTMLSSTGYGIFGAAVTENIGHSLSSAGDFNADGIDDLLIASYLRDDAGADSGAAWLITGVTGNARADLNINSITAADGFRISGGGVGDHFGQSTSFGDVNGDGKSDLIVGATAGDNASIDGGETVVLWGREFGTALTNGLTGTASADKLVGTSGNDTIVSGGGADAISAGAGNDTIQLVDTAFINIEGGEGTDILQFTTGPNTLDLNAFGPETINGIEVIDLGSTGTSLTVSKASVQDMSRESRALFVRGSLGSVTSSSGDAWCYTGTRAVGGITYHTYLDNGAILYIQNGLTHSNVGNFNSTQTYTFNTTVFGANVSSSVTNFPVLIRISNTIRNTLQAGRADIRFTDRDQVSWLPYEIEIGASGELYAWVLVPQVDGNSSSDSIVLHYNDKVDGSVPDRQDPPRVWVDYAGVWHFDEASGNALDSTAYQNNGTQTGTVSRVSYGVGRGAEFNSTTENFTVPYDISMNVSGRAWSVLAWQNYSSCNAWASSGVNLVNRGTSGNFWQLESAYTVTFVTLYQAPKAYIGSDTLGGGGVITWVGGGCESHLALTYDPSVTTKSRMYTNATDTGTSNTAQTVEALQTMVMGNTGTSNDTQLDEVRLGRMAFSADYIKLSYENQGSTSLVSPGNF